MLQSSFGFILLSNYVVNPRKYCQFFFIAIMLNIELFMWTF